MSASPVAVISAECRVPIRDRLAADEARGMKTLSSTLTAHQAGGLRRPSVSVIGADLHGGVPFLRWTRWYSGAEAEVPHAAAVADDGSLTRIRNDSGTMRQQRVTTPTSGSTYSSWNSLGACVASTGCAIAAEPGGARMVMVYVKTGQLRLSYRFSSDYGASWSSATDVQSSNEAAAITWCAVTWNGNGWRVYYDVSGTIRTRSEGATTSGAWGSSTTITPPSTSSLNGIAAQYYPTAGEIGLVVTLFSTTVLDSVVYAYSAGTGADTSNEWRELWRSDGAGTLGPVSMPYLSAVGDTPVLFWRERETGDVAYSRIFMSRGEIDSAGDGWFSEPAPVDVHGSAFGAAVAHIDGEARWYLCFPGGVYAADAYTEDDEQDYGWMMVSVDEKRGLFSGRVKITLDNAAGLLDMTWPGLTPGATLRVRLGYRTSAGEEFGTEQVYTTERVTEYTTRYGERRIDIEAFGVWERLAATRASRLSQVAGFAGSRESFFAAAVARAGGVRIQRDVTHGVSGEWATDHEPSLSVRPGQSWFPVARDLLAAELEHAVPDGDALKVRGIPSSEASDLDLAVSGGDHQLVSFRRIAQLPAYNWSRVIGDARYSDRFTHASIEAAGPRMQPMTEDDADTDAKANAYGDGQLARARWATPTAEATFPWHAGLEICDVVEVTDPRLAETAGLYRVIELRGRLDTETAMYTATATLAPR